VSKSGALTFWRAQVEEQMRTQKESEQARGTHGLESTEGGTNEDTERKRASEGYSRPRACRGMDK
jgi:hypothetical protein